MLHSRIIERLKALRAAAEISQVELAKRMKVSSGTIGNYEAMSREPPLDVIEVWAEKLGHQVHLIITATREEAVQMLPERDRKLLEVVRQLREEDRTLVEDMSRGLYKGDRLIREMIAVQVPILLKSCPSGEEGSLPARRQG